MNKLSRLLILLLIPICAGSVLFARETKNIDFNWRFHAGDLKGAEKTGHADADWRKLDIPHDWSIEGEYAEDNPTGGRSGYLPTGIIWYRKDINISDDWAKKKVSIEFDSVFMNSTVWINGKKLGDRPYGYVTFSYDLTPHLKKGKNVIAVRVDNTLQPSGRWYTGTGIFGSVHLVANNKIHLRRGGIFFQTLEATSENAKIQVETHSVGQANTTIFSQLLDENRKVIASSKNRITGNGLIQFMDIDEPKLWSVDQPYLYTLKTILRSGGETVDEVETKVGIRTLTFDHEKGFFLNGVSMKMKGVCEHHDGGPVGGAFPEKILRERILLLKEMGCNAIRTAHNPRTQEFYQLCNELGMMVMDEIFDGWHRKAEQDYGGRFWDEWWKKDVEEWIRANRNHPCIVMYSIGNETGEEDINDISGLIKRFDKTRPTTGGTVLEGVDIQGYNGPGGLPGSMQKFHEEFPGEICVKTEVPHTLQTRGFYRVRTWWRDRGRPRNDIPDYGTEQIFFDGHPRYSSNYDNCAVRITARTSWRETRDMPWIIGEFRWTGFDYIGEASFSSGEWPARIWNFGVIDLAGLPKDHFYFYQSQWTEEPMVHILPHWTHRFLDNGTVVPVVAYSNCEEVELFLNGKSLGKQSEDPEWLEFVWKVPYAPGELKAVGYEKGKPVAEKIWNTTGSPVSLKLGTNNSDLATDRLDTATFTFQALDENGDNVPWVMNRVEFAIEGPVKNLGFENGDPVDVNPHRVNYRNLFYGYGRGFFQATAGKEPIQITAAAILGDTLFEESERVAIDARKIMLRGMNTQERYTIRYTTDGSDPVRGPVYKKPFVLNKSTTVRAVVMRGGKPLLTLSQEFTKGKKPVISDKRWAPEYSDTAWGASATGYDGPFDKELIGKWTSGKRVIEFRPDGIVYENTGETEEKQLAYWCYDFPDDYFEAGAYAGSGQMNWLPKLSQVSDLQLETQEANTLLVTGKNGKPQAYQRVND